MTLLQKIDAVLKWSYDNSGSNPTLEAIHEGVKETGIDIGETRDCVRKLIKDDLMYSESEKYINVQPFEDYHHCLINFNGKFFWETIGGFEKQNQAKIASDTRTDVRDKMLSSGTVWLAVLTGLLVFVEALEHWDVISKLFYCR